LLKINDDPGISKRFVMPATPTKRVVNAGIVNTRGVVCAWSLFWALMALIAVQEYRCSGGVALWR
jgi:hypothetical protein